MRALVACLVCLVGCASSTYLEPLGEPAPDAAAEALADAAAPAPEAPAPDVARVEPAREVSVQVEAAAPDAGAPEAAVDATALDVAPDAPKAIEAAADVAVEVEVAPDTSRVVDAGPASIEEACGAERACAGEGVMPDTNNGTGSRCATDPHPIPLWTDGPIVPTFCARLCRSGGATGPSSGCWTGCCAYLREENGVTINVCLGPENCK